MTTLYDDYVWGGGEQQYGSYDNFKKHRDMDRILPRHPTITHIPSPIEEKKEDKKITRPDNAASVAYDNLKAAVEKLQYESEQDRKELSDLRAKANIHTGTITSLLKRIEEIEKSNKELRGLLNIYNRFDIMEVEDGSSSE